MSRATGCLLGIIGLMMLVIVAGSWFLSDPIRGLWTIADINGGLSKWEDRTVKVVSIVRKCRMPLHNEEGLAPDAGQAICDSPSDLRDEFARMSKKAVLGQPCFDEGTSGKHCPGIPPRLSGEADVTVEGVNQSDGKFTAHLRVRSSQPTFYLLNEGDVLVVGICRKNPTIARKDAVFEKIPGC